MIARQGRWAEVEPGMYVRDKADHTWRIDGAEDGKIVLVNPVGQRRLLTPPDRSAPVTIMEPAHDEAVALVQGRLGGEVEAETRGDETRCPLWPSRLVEARSHLFIMHGMYAEDIKSIKGATEAHEASHADPDRGYVPHTHGGI